MVTVDDGQVGRTIAIVISGREPGRQLLDRVCHGLDRGPALEVDDDDLVPDVIGERDLGVAVGARVGVGVATGRSLSALSIALLNSLAAK